MMLAFLTEPDGFVLSVTSWNKSLVSYSPGPGHSFVLVRLANLAGLTDGWMEIRTIKLN